MIRGVLLPIITPFDEKVRVDEQMMRRLVDFHIAAGVQGLFVLGSTGQGPAMTTEERRQTAAIALDQAKGRVPVIIHVGTADTGSAVELAEHAAAHKADAVAIVPPYYYSDHTEYEIMAHYKAVHKAVPLPIYIYENPKYSGISIPPGFAVRMEEQVPALKGIKVAYGQGALLEYVRLLPDVSVFTGNADLFGLVPFGVAGMINPPTSFVPELCVELFKALDGEEADALRVEAHVTVAVDPAAAFSAFTAGLGTWWPAAYSWGPAALDRHGLEPMDGGRITEFHADGYQLDWGRVVDWDPPSRLVLHWAIGPDRVPCPDTPTRVTVQFLADGSSTRVVVVHDLFEAHGEAGLGYAEALRGEDGWPHLLACFAEPLGT